MKYPCELVRDMMPLYKDNICSEDSRLMVEGHMNICQSCMDYYRLLDSEMVYSVNAQESEEDRIKESFKRIEIKAKKRNTKMVLTIIALVIAWHILIPLLFLGLFYWGFTESQIEVHKDVAEYEFFRNGYEDSNDYATKWGMDESIWPEKITESMEVKDYTMVYYNPWDAQWLGYLEVDYDAAAYQEEVERLSSYKSTEYKGYYGVTGFTKYQLLAMYADDYNGFVYALTDGKSKIIYCEAIFCNYFMDLDYTQYVPEDYLPDGFDATIDNPYQDKMME